MLILAGWISQPLRWSPVGSPAEPGRMPSREGFDSGLVGLRELSAAFGWVGVYRDWRRRDEEAMIRGLEWTVRLDPNTLTYWLEGARMITYDVAAWRRTEAEGRDGEAVQREQLLRGIAWLDRARHRHPGEAALPIEQAVMWWSIARDAARAERALAAAQECAEVPYYVVRIRAEMLIHLGREAAARDLLQQELPRLSRGDPRAMRAVVEQRIRELSDGLKPE